MLKISSNIPKIVSGIKPADEKILSEMVERSKKIMSEFGTMFKSKTLGKLYTDEYHYQGDLPLATYIIDKKTGKRRIMYIDRITVKTSCYKDCMREKYECSTKRKNYIGTKSFITAPQNPKSKIIPGVMRSYNNDIYAGTQIRLTQIEVERAMQMGEERIPLKSFAEALPFHTMMGFRPDESYVAVNSVKDVNNEMEKIRKECVDIHKKHFTPIIHKKDGEYYLDRNQTVANATLRELKEQQDYGIKRDYNKGVRALIINMNLSGKDLKLGNNEHYPNRYYWGNLKNKYAKLVSRSKTTLLRQAE